MLLLHASWSQGRLHLWGEAALHRNDVPSGARLNPVLTGAPSSADAPPPVPALAPGEAVQSADPTPEVPAPQSPRHPGAASCDELVQVLPAAAPWAAAAKPSSLTLLLPVRAGVPIPSPALAHATGHSSTDDLAEQDLAQFTAPTLAFDPTDVPEVLEYLDDLAEAGGDDPLAENGEARAGVLAGGVGVGAGVTFYAACVRLVNYLCAQQRFVPALINEIGGELAGIWQPWLADAPTLARLDALMSAMPPIARAAVDPADHKGWVIVGEMLSRITDATCRRTLQREELTDALGSRDPAADTHVALLAGLLGPTREIVAGLAQRQELIRGMRTWVGLLEDRGSGESWRLLLRLAEPIDIGELHDFDAPGSDVRWALSLHLQLVDQPSIVIDAIDIWALSGAGAAIEGRRIDSPHELLLAELGRAARLYRTLEQALDQTEPTELLLTTTEAYRFLREFAPILQEQGVGVDVPAWWNSPTVRLGARLKVDSEPMAVIAAQGIGAPSRTTTQLGLSTLVSYQWQIAVGRTTLTLEQFESLAAQHSPLIRVDGQWVEIRPEDVKAAMDFLKKNPGGEMEVGRALRLAYASDARQTGIQILGMDATGWVASVFGDPSRNETLPILEPPPAPHFIGTLRTYQVKGLSWLAFLDRLGLGACLADDMGLGKTVQLLALLANERVPYMETMGTDNPAPRPEPTLLVVPMSVVGNWIHEAKRFTPNIKVLVHHGLDRLQGERLLEAAVDSDVVITTYALAHRDHEQLGAIRWRRVVLDEAQNIKNPGAKQTQAIRAIATGRRIALTGTPVENRLGELWSIMEFLNPGYLDPAGEFRRRFSVPIERYHDKHRAAQLRGLVQPFVLRRLKSDPAVIADLPEKVESREYCFLTPEQASLYQTCVSDMLSVAEQTDGIQRRGIVLAGLIKLKQICNHPSHFLKEQQHDLDAGLFDPSRSGKSLRLVEMLRETVDAGDKALVFTQFRQMGHILAAMLRRELDRDVLFLHGGTTSQQREEMVARFQRTGAENPVFILSLKAGGLGLNLTAATHVFHFDRWWNPAVESQATDRAYRIGQTRTVHVHKFVVSGTLEERIDQMIEQKVELAENVIGSGERWLTELSTSQLREILSLRLDAVGDDQ